MKRAGPEALPKRVLTDKDAIDIWIARWLRVRRIDLIRRYDCDPRRLYEIWEEERFAGSRERALKKFREQFPSLVDRIDPGRHTRVSRDAGPGQLSLFD